ncbi:MFS transporter [Streptomyces sp. DT2A-34]|uniref:MFS transporter n=1 Tax=Streptomyces sp. DT2A-34 TaxID=3051182 RepID=UPI00265C4B2B|nr:MFS transporter [Streptomyces sp. DT2A-34]MDO0914350.1 MFS transporter [Streptomyces sp. DT2A-34]
MTTADIGRRDAADPPRAVRDFALLQAAGFCGSMATRCLEIAVAWWMLDRTGNDALLGIVLGLGIGADVLSRGALGWVGDRFRPQRVILCCFLVSACVSGALAGLAYAGVYQLWIVLLGVTLLGVSLGVREPLLMSTIRSLMDTSAVAGAVRVRSAMMSLSSFAGPVVAGMLIGPLGYSAVLGAASVVVVVCATLAALLRVPDDPARTDGARERGFAVWAAEAGAGFRAIRRVVPEWRLAMLTMVVDFALFPVFALVIPVLVAAHYPGRTWVLSVVESAFAVGMILGSSLLAKKSNALLGRRRTVLGGFAALGVGFVGTGVLFSVTGADLPLAFTAGGSLLLMLSGAGLCLVTINTGTVRLLATPSAYRNRMVAAASFLSGIVMPLGSISSGLLSRASGQWWTLVALGAAICVCAAVAAYDRQLTRFLDLPDEQLDDAYLREFPSAFDASTPRIEKTRA